MRDTYDFIMQNGEDFFCDSPEKTRNHIEGRLSQQPPLVDSGEDFRVIPVVILMRRSVALRFRKEAKRSGKSLPVFLSDLLEDLELPC